MTASLKDQIDSVQDYLRRCVPPAPQDSDVPHPRFQRAEWDGNKHNCLTYAAHIASPEYSQHAPKWGNAAENPETLCGIFNKLVTMGFKPAPLAAGGAVPPEIDGYYLTALFVGRNPDAHFHFMKCDGERGSKGRRAWSELLPGQAPKNRDDLGRAIYDPRKAFFYQGNMTNNFLCFFYLPHGGVGACQKRALYAAPPPPPSGRLVIDGRDRPHP